MERAARDVRLRNHTPFVIPLGASTPLGAAAFVAAISELADQIDPPDVIVHASSSGGTQAGLVAGCALAGWHTNVVGISADEPADSLTSTVRELLAGLAKLLDCEPDRLASGSVIVDDGFVGEGYGIPTVASREAVDLAATTEALFVDHTYTAKGTGWSNLARAQPNLQQREHRALLAHGWAGRAFRVRTEKLKVIS